jgi:hypothetical protein
MIQLMADPRVVASWGILLVGIACVLLALTGVVNTFSPERMRERAARAQLVKNALSMAGDTSQKQASFHHEAFVSSATPNDDVPRVEYYYKKRCRKCLQAKPTWESFYADVQSNPIGAVVLVSIDGGTLSEAQIRALPFEDLPTIAFRKTKDADPSVYKGAIDVVALRTWVREMVQ